ncbi:CREB-binding protein isoform X3 [Silurus meridionalis]|nr:CREB-binding protein isoform X3 [Silurus meridionalis]
MAEQGSLCRRRANTPSVLHLFQPRRPTITPAPATDSCSCPAVFIYRLRELYEKGEGGRESLDQSGRRELSSLSWDDLESNLPDELIPSGPNGDLGLMAMPSNGSGGGATGMADAAAKHKQLSELLRAGSGTGLNSSSPGQGVGMGPQLGALGKSPLGQGSPSHASPTPKPAGGAPPGSAGMGLNPGFNQAMLNNGMMAQSAAAQQQGQVMNGTLGPGGRGRGAPGMQYQGPASVGQQVAAAGAAPGGAGSVLAETLTQGAQQMGINPQQSSNMNKHASQRRFSNV